MEIGLEYHYCQESGVGLCKVGLVRFTVPLVIAEDGSTEPVVLSHQVAR